MTSTTRTPKTITTPTFTIRSGYAGITVTIPGHVVTLFGGEGEYEVHLQTAPCLTKKIGRVSKDGTGWTAFQAEGGKGVMPSFVGDHFPTRTGKHTQMYAICVLVALAAGMSATAATYDLRYEGVRA